MAARINDVWRTGATRCGFSKEVILFGGDMYSTYFAPPFGTPVTVIFCRFLRSAGKQKILISFGNQDFTVFCFSSKWCHQITNIGIL